MNADELREKRNARYRERHRERVLEMQRSWRDRNRDKLREDARRARIWWQRWLDVLKQEQGCLDCGTKAGRLHYHHTDPATKLYNANKMRTYRFEKWIDELAKCVVLCASCHRKRHIKMQREARA